MTDLLQPTAREHFKVALNTMRAVNDMVQKALIQHDPAEGMLRQMAEGMGVVCAQIVLGLEQIDKGRI